jgi:AGCS family alanine or glycine:cation symporter
MIEHINETLRTISNFVWGWPLVVLLLGAGIVLTVYHGFIQFRGFWLALRLVSGRTNLNDGPGAVSHFKALCTALSATVGLGNIAGVAIAIKLGGPGATLWMMLVGIVGMATKFNECALACLYRTVHPDGQISGGPMHYIKLTPFGRPLAFMYAVFLIIAAYGAANMFQANQIAIAFNNSFGIPNYASGIVLAILTAMVILGGMTRIANVASFIVPIMAISYLAMCFLVIQANWENVGNSLSLIFNGAFNGSAATGGFAGAALAATITAGVRRALFSCEAGVGTAAIAHSIVKTSRPVSEGFVALLEPFIDTVIVCTATALAVVMSGAYTQNIEGGVGVAAFAFESIAPGVGGIFIAIAVFLFGYSTMISWSLYGEQATKYIFKTDSSVFKYRILFSLVPILGCIWSLEPIMNLSDIAFGMLVIPNIWAFLFLSKKVKTEAEALIRDLA